MLDVVQRTLGAAGIHDREQGCSGPRARRSEPTERFDTANARKSNIGQHHVHGERARKGKDFAVVARLADNIDVGLQFQDAPKRMAELVVRVGNQDASHWENGLLISRDVSVALPSSLLVGLVVLPGRCIGHS